MTTDVIQPIGTCCSVHCWQGCNSLSPAFLVGVAWVTYVSSCLGSGIRWSLTQTQTHTHTPLSYTGGHWWLHQPTSYMWYCVYTVYNRWGTWTYGLVQNRRVQPLCPSTQPVCLWWRQWRRVDVVTPGPANRELKCLNLGSQSQTLDACWVISRGL